MLLSTAVHSDLPASIALTPSCCDHLHFESTEPLTSLSATMTQPNTASHVSRHPSPATEHTERLRRLESSNTLTHDSPSSTQQSSRTSSVDREKRTRMTTPASKSKRVRQYMAQDLDRSWFTIVLVACFFQSGLLDSVAFNSWSCFVGMQTGTSNALRHQHILIPTQATQYSSLWASVVNLELATSNNTTNHSSRLPASASVLSSSPPCTAFRLVSPRLQDRVADGSSRPHSSCRRPSSCLQPSL